MPAFDPERYYTTTDSELSLLGSPTALAQRHHRGKSPRYHKVGRRVRYRGRDLNDFLDQCAVEPTTAREAARGTTSPDH